MLMASPIPSTSTVECYKRSAMIHSMRINNFRCFEELAIDDLGAINVIVGDNAAGKTALLESIFLACTGGPEVAMRMRAWRGSGQFMSIGRTRFIYESLWQDLFYRLDQRREIKIELIGTPENARSFRAWYDIRMPRPRCRYPPGTGQLQRRNNQMILQASSLSHLSCGTPTERNTNSSLRSRLRAWYWVA